MVKAEREPRWLKALSAGWFAKTSKKALKRDADPALGKMVKRVFLWTLETSRKLGGLIGKLALNKAKRQFGEAHMLLIGW